jgi:hypothetical protein
MGCNEDIETYLPKRALNAEPATANIKTTARKMFEVWNSRQARRVVGCLTSWKPWRINRAVALPTGME